MYSNKCCGIYNYFLVLIQYINILCAVKNKYAILFWSYNLISSHFYILSKEYLLPLHITSTISCMSHVCLCITHITNHMKFSSPYISMYLSIHNIKFYWLPPDVTSTILYLSLHCSYNNIIWNFPSPYISMYPSIHNIKFYLITTRCHWSLILSHLCLCIANITGHMEFFISIHINVSIHPQYKILLITTRCH